MIGGGFAWDQSRGPHSSWEVDANSYPHWQRDRDCTQRRPGKNFEKYLTNECTWIYLQPLTWAQKLFKEGSNIIDGAPKLSERSRAGTVAPTRSSTPSKPFTNNSKAPSMEKNAKIPGLFLAKAEKASRKRPVPSSKREGKNTNHVKKPIEVTASCTGICAASFKIFRL